MYFLLVVDIFLLESFVTLIGKFHNYWLNIIGKSGVLSSVSMLLFYVIYFLAVLSTFKYSSFSNGIIMSVEQGALLVTLTVNVSIKMEIYCDNYFFDMDRTDPIRPLSSYLLAALSARTTFLRCRWRRCHHGQLLLSKFETISIIV